MSTENLLPHSTCSYCYAVKVPVMALSGNPLPGQVVSQTLLVSHLDALTPGVFPLCWSWHETQELRGPLTRLWDWRLGILQCHISIYLLNNVLANNITTTNIFEKIDFEALNFFDENNSRNIMVWYFNMLGSCPRTGDIVRSIGLYVITLQTYLFINNNSM